MANMNILFGMSTTTIQRDHVIKPYILWLHWLFADVAPITIAFKNMLITYLPYLCISLERATFIIALATFQQICLLPCFGINAALFLMGFIVAMIIFAQPLTIRLHIHSIIYTPFFWIITLLFLLANMFLMVFFPLAATFIVTFFAIWHMPTSPVALLVKLFDRFFNMTHRTNSRDLWWLRGQLLSNTLFFLSQTANFAPRREFIFIRRFFLELLNGFFDATFCTNFRENKQWGLSYQHAWIFVAYLTVASATAQSASRAIKLVERLFNPALGANFRGDLGRVVYFVHGESSPCRCSSLGLYRGLNTVQPAFCASIVPQNPIEYESISSYANFLAVRGCS